MVSRLVFCENATAVQWSTGNDVSSFDLIICVSFMLTFSRKLRCCTTKTLSWKGKGYVERKETLTQVMATSKNNEATVLAMTKNTTKVVPRQSIKFQLLHKNRDYILNSFYFPSHRVKLEQEPAKHDPLL